MKADRGIDMSIPLAFASWCLPLKVPATTPKPDSTSAWPREPALEPSKGISFRAWKFRGLRPRTTMGAVVDSAMTTLELLESVATTLRCKTKCCWSSFLRPLLAVALTLRQLYQLPWRDRNAHSELQPPPSYRIHGKFPIRIRIILLERDQG